MKYCFLKHTINQAMTICVLTDHIHFIEQILIYLELIHKLLIKNVVQAGDTDHIKHQKPEAPIQQQAPDGGIGHRCRFRRRLTRGQDAQAWFDPVDKHGHQHRTQ